jgi:hypothetical protein
MAEPAIKSHPIPKRKKLFESASVEGADGRLGYYFYEGTHGRD